MVRALFGTIRFGTPDRKSTATSGGAALCRALSINFGFGTCPIPYRGNIGRECGLMHPLITIACIMNTSSSPTNTISADVSKVATDPSSGSDVHAPTHTIPTTRMENDVQTTQNTTVFADGGTVVKGSVLPTAPASLAMARRNLTLQNQSILDFFAKPQLITTPVWNTTGNPGDSLAQVLLPWDIFAASSAMSARLDNFTSFRGDVMVRIHVNPAMAASGKLLAVFEPLYGVLTDGGSGVYSLREGSLVSLTQMPKVELDLATDRTLEFRIPFRVPLNYLPTVSAPSWMDMGRLNLFIYAPLRSSALSSLPVSVWMWFDPDTISLANPTVSLHSLPAFAKNKKANNKFKVVKQVGGGGVLAQEQSSRPVSSMLSKVATIAQTAAMVPVLTEFAEPVAWAASLGAGVAATLGFSNPRTEKVPDAVISRPMRDLCTVDQAVPGFVYAFTGAAKVGKVPPGGLTEEDELHFGHLLPMSVWNQTVVWETTDTSDTPLVQDLGVGLGLGIDNVTIGVSTYDVMTPWRAIAGMFAYWRGNIRITIKIAKTRFHSGRLVAFFDADPASVHPSMDNSEVLPRLILDLESGNEWTFEFPFPAINTYLSTNDTTTIGNFSLFVLTPLTVCGSASGSVDVILETSMRADASFMYPSGLAYQVGGTLPNSSEQEITTTNLSVTPFQDPVDLEEACVGDFCRTLRSYIKRPVWYNGFSSGAVEVLLNTPYQTPNPVLQRIGTWYTLVRGSTRVTAFSNSRNVVRMRLPQSQIDSSSSDTGYLQYMQANGVYDYEAPQMATMPWRYNTLSVPDDTQGIFQYPVIQFSSLNPTNDFLAVSTADDFDLALFIGVPPVPAVPEKAHVRHPARSVREPRVLALDD